MRHFRNGFGQLDIIIGIVLVTAVAAGLWRLWAYAYSEGERDAKLAFATRDNTALIKARAEVAKLHADVRALEDQHAIEVAAIDTQGQEELRRVQAAKEKFVGDVAAGRIRLFDPHARCPDNRGDPASEMARNPGVDHAAGGAELSKEAAGFLSNEASHADAVVVRLTACQAILRDRQ